MIATLHVYQIYHSNSEKIFNYGELGNCKTGH